jgi:hypothetical protein
MSLRWSVVKGVVNSMKNIASTSAYLLRGGNVNVPPTMSGSTEEAFSKPSANVFEDAPQQIISKQKPKKGVLKHDPTVRYYMALEHIDFIGDKQFEKAAATIRKALNLCLILDYYNISAPGKNWGPRISVEVAECFYHDYKQMIDRCIEWARTVGGSTKSVLPRSSLASLAFYLLQDKCFEEYEEGKPNEMVGEFLANLVCPELAKALPAQMTKVRESLWEHGRKCRANMQGKNGQLRPICETDDVQLCGMILAAWQAHTGRRAFDESVYNYDFIKESFPFIPLISAQERNYAELTMNLIYE